MSARVILVGAVCSIASASAAWWLAESRAVAPPASAELRAAEAPAEPSREERNLLELAAIGAVVRTEIDQGLSRQAATAAAASPSVVQPIAEASSSAKETSEAEVADEPSNAYLQSKRQVSDSIRRGVWTEEDQKSVSASFIGMSRTERREIMGEVIRAVNRGALKVESAPLFL